MYVKKGVRRIGGWSALLAAYAFVLNALLATTLLAATPPAKSLSGFELCTASADASTPFEHDDTATKRAAIHCQLCLAHAVPAALPPPSDLALLVPVANAVAFVATCIDAPSPPQRFADHRPRGPPHLT